MGESRGFRFRRSLLEASQADLERDTSAACRFAIPSPRESPLGFNGLYGAAATESPRNINAA